MCNIYWSVPHYCSLLSYSIGSCASQSPFPPLFVLILTRYQTSRLQLQWILWMTSKWLHCKDLLRVILCFDLMLIDGTKSASQRRALSPMISRSSQIQKVRISFFAEFPSGVAILTAMLSSSLGSTSRSAHLWIPHLWVTAIKSAMMKMFAGTWCCLSYCQLMILFFCLSSSMWVFPEYRHWLAEGVAVINPVFWDMLKLQQGS